MKICMAISLNWLSKDKSHVLKLPTNWRSKPCFCNICVVSFHNWLNSKSERFLFPLWDSVFLEFLRSVTSESYFFGNFLSIILVYSVRSNLFSSVIPFDGQSISCWSLYRHIFDLKPSNSLYNFAPSVGRCSLVWSTAWHKCLPAKSIRVATRSHFSYSLNKLLFVTAIPEMVRCWDLSSFWKRKQGKIYIFFAYLSYRGLIDLKMFNYISGSCTEAYCLLLVIIKVMQTVSKTNCIIDTSVPSKTLQKF